MVHFVFIRRNGLYFVAVTKFNVAPACALELIGRFITPLELHYMLIYCSFRIAGLSKDYCGVLNEESIRLNFILVYELLDEVLVSMLTLPLLTLSITLCRILGTHKEQIQRC